MTIATTAFDRVYTQQGAIDKMRDAVCDILDGDTNFRAWLAQPVIRSVLFALPQGIKSPWCAVSALAVRSTPEPSSRTKLQIPVGIMVGFEEFRQEYQPGAVTAATLYDVLGAILFAKIDTANNVLTSNYHLQVSRYSNVSLAQRIEDFAPVNIGAQTNADGKSTSIAIQFEVTYETSLNVFTRAIVLPR